MTQLNEEIEREFITCARYGELEELKELLEQNGPKLLSSKAFNNNNALHMAAANGHIDIIDFLTSRPEGFEIDLANVTGNTPLHWAAMNGHLEAVKLLIDRGANLMLKNGLGRTAFTEAISAGHEQTAEILLANMEVENDSREDEIENSDEQNEEGVENETAK